MFDDGLFSGMYEMHDQEKAAEEATLASLSTERYLELARKCCYSDCYSSISICLCLR